MSPVPRAILAGCLAASGCYFEIWAGGSPWTHTSAGLDGDPAAETETTTWSAGAAVGVWLEAFGVGLGVAPSGTAGNVTYDADAAGGDVTVKALHTRVDVDLPTRWLSPWIDPRLTFAYDRVREAVLGIGGASGATTPATGYAAYAGLTWTTFNRGLALSIGPSYQTYDASTGIGQPRALVTSMRTVALQARLHLTFNPPLEMMRFYTPSVIRPLPEAPAYKEPSLNRVENPTGCAWNPHCY